MEICQQQKTPTLVEENQMQLNQEVDKRVDMFVPGVRPYLFEPVHGHLQQLRKERYGEV